MGFLGAYIGLALDRQGPKKVIPICVLLTVIGLLPLIYTNMWIYPTLGRALIGIGSSGAILGVFKIIRMFFREDQFTRMLGISVTIGLLGAIYGGNPVHYLMNSFGWVDVLHVMILIGVALAVILYIYLPSHEMMEENNQSIWQDIKTVLSNGKVVAICLLAGLMVGPLEGFADVWGTEFLKVSYNLSESIASTLPSMIFLGMCFGAPFLSYLADKTKAYYQIIMLSAFVMGTSFAIILSVTLPTNILTIVFVIIGVLCSYQILSIYKATTYVDSKLFSLTTACANMIIMFFGYVFHSLIGIIVQFNWDGLQSSSNTPIYNSSAFTAGLSVIPIDLLIALVGYGIIYFTEKKQQQHLIKSLPLRAEL